MIKAVVIGVGHLGRFHAQKVKEIAQLVGIVEPNPERRAEMQKELDCPAYATIAEVPSAQAAIIAAPTSMHFEAAKACLDRGWHVLIEKPVVRTLEEGKALLALQQQHPKLVISVGHIERFNPAVLAAEKFGDTPWYLVAERLGPFKVRSTDVDVIDDLMIHDIDLCLRWFKSDPLEIRAVGVSIFTEHVDMANARIEFKNGAVASLTASRSSLDSSRKIRLFSANRYLSLDLGAKTGKSVKRHPAKEGQEWPEIEMELVEVTASDAMLEEDRAFFLACKGERETPVSLVDAVRALELAEAVKKALKTPGIESLTKSP